MGRRGDLPGGRFFFGSWPRKRHERPLACRIGGDVPREFTDFGACGGVVGVAKGDAGSLNDRRARTIRESLQTRLSAGLEVPRVR